MNISKINSLNFTSKRETPNENKQNCKKSHTGAITGLAVAAAIDTVPHIFQKNKIANVIRNYISCEKLLSNDLSSILKVKVSPAAKKILGFVGIATDLYFGYEVGKWVDKKISKKQPQKEQVL